MQIYIFPNKMKLHILPVWVSHVIIEKINGSTNTNSAVGGVWVYKFWKRNTLLNTKLLEWNIGQDHSVLSKNTLTPVSMQGLAISAIIAAKKHFTI